MEIFKNIFKIIDKCSDFKNVPKNIKYAYCSQTLYNILSETNGNIARPMTYLEYSCDIVKIFWAMWNYFFKCYKNLSNA